MLSPNAHASIAGPPSSMPWRPPQKNYQLHIQENIYNDTRSGPQQYGSRLLGAFFLSCETAIGDLEFGGRLKEEIRISRDSDGGFGREDL